MKKIILLILILLPVIGFAQQNNGIQVDLESKDSVNLTGIDLTKLIPISIVHTEKLKRLPTVEVRFEYPGHHMEDKPILYPDPYSFKTSQLGIVGAPATDIIISLFIDRGTGLQLKKKLKLTVKGEVQSVDGAATTEPIYYDRTAKADHSFTGAYKDSTNYKFIVYDPCLNTYQVWNKGNLRHGLWYRPFWSKGAPGVILIIKNFNTLKYDVTYSSDFTNRFTDLPDLFSTVSTLISTGTKANSGGDNIQKDLYQIISLNTDLKRILDENCMDFEAVKKQVLANAILNFGTADGIVAIDNTYNVDKADFITRNFPAPKPAPAVSATPTGGVPAASTRQQGSAPDPNTLKQDGKGKDDAKTTNTVKAFNDTIQKMYHLPYAPDSLVSETVLLYNTLMSTKFRYQGNIIQLQNADELVLTLNIAPKANAKNTSLAVTNQLIKIPVMGGVKADFSSGFYYSGVKNETYGLQNITVNDTAKKHIVMEKNFNSGTVGIAAFVHVYPRISPGFNVSLTAGVGKALDMNYSLLAGGSLIFGRESRFVLSTGFNFANVKALSQGNIATNGQYIDLPATATDATYYNKFRRTWFAGLSYSIGSTASKQAASAATPASSTDTSAAAASSASGTGGGGGGGGKGKGKN